MAKVSVYFTEMKKVAEFYNTKLVLFINHFFLYITDSLKALFYMYSALLR